MQPVVIAQPIAAVQKHGGELRLLSSGSHSLALHSSSEAVKLKSPNKLPLVNIFANNHKGVTKATGKTWACNSTSSSEAFSLIIESRWKISI